MAKKHNIRGVPATYFYKDGEKVKEHLGSMSLEEVKEVIGEFMY